MKVKVKVPHQVFVSHSLPCASRMHPVRNQKDFPKPSGGLWTSTADRGGGEWIRWLLAEGYSLSARTLGGKIWLLRPVPARVAIIGGPREFLELANRYPAGPHLGVIDWEALAEEWDAVWTPNPSRWRYASGCSGRFFDSLDVECTIWFRWCFEGPPKELDPPAT
jgi:hypothetical protein